MTVHFRDPTKGYILPYYVYSPTVTEGGSLPNLNPKPLRASDSGLGYSGEVQGPCGNNCCAIPCGVYSMGIM